jgi:hypothetical protein
VSSSSWPHAILGSHTYSMAHRSALPCSEMKMRPKKAPQTSLARKNCPFTKFALILATSVSLRFLAASRSRSCTHTPLCFPSARRAKSPGSAFRQTLENSNEIASRIALPRELLFLPSVLHCCFISPVSGKQTSPKTFQPARRCIPWRSARPYRGPQSRNGRRPETAGERCARARSCGSPPFRHV